MPRAYPVELRERCLPVACDRANERPARAVREGVEGHPLTGRRAAIGVVEICADRRFIEKDQAALSHRWPLRLKRLTLGEHLFAQRGWRAETPFFRVNPNVSFTARLIVARDMATPNSSS